MINDQTIKIWKDVFDQISYTPAHVTKADRERVELGKRVRLIAIDLELSGQEADARVLMEAAGALMRG